MASLSSLLGLAPPPVIAPGAVDRRLSKTERRVAAAAFHRARGYGDRVDFPRFRDTVLHEAFGAVPLYVAQRLFMVWNFAGGASTGGALTLKEFLVGVTIAWKGTRDEQLRWAFQLMDRRGDQELSKRDALAFLKAVAMPGGIVATDATRRKSWNVDELADMLFPSESTLLTPSKFVKAISSRSFSSLALVDWIPKLAAQFEREKEKLTFAVTPVSKPVAASDEDGDGLMTTIMVKLRRINSGDNVASSLPVKTPKDSSPTLSIVCEKERNIIQIEPMTADQFQTLKHVVGSLVSDVLLSRESISEDEIRERLREVVPPTVLQATQATAKACAGDFFLSRPSSDKGGPNDADTYLRSQSKARILWWILCICCSCARSSAEVARYLFVLFDEQSRGYWTHAQLTKFIQCVDLEEEDQSSEEEAAFLAQTVLEEIAATTNSSSSSLLSEDDTPTGVTFRFRDFEKYLARYPIPGCSAADIDIVFTLLHADLAKHRGQQLSHSAYLEALHSFCDQLIAHEVTTQLGFCLTYRPSWERLVDWMCDYDLELPLVKMLKNDVCTAVETVGQLNGAVSEDDVQDDVDATPLVAVPISLWIVLATKLRERSGVEQANHQDSWADAVTRLMFATPGSSDYRKAGESTDDSWSFYALLASVSLTVAARDGSECSIEIPYCVVDREVTLQTLVQAALSLHGRERPSVQQGMSIIAAHPKGAFYCEGAVIFFDKSEQRQKVEVSQGILLIPLSTLDEGSGSRRLQVTMNVLLTDERSSSHLPRWQTPMISSPASSQRSGASTPSSRTPKHSKRGATTGWTKVHGLANLGNTCFMNSALQCLAATPIMREYFLKGEHLYDISTHTVTVPTGSPFRPGKKTAMNGVEVQLPKSSLLPVAFGQLLAEMNAYSSNGSVSGMADVISPKYMKTAIATLFPHLSDGTQQDAQEFLTSLLSSLSDELKRLPIDEARNGSNVAAQVSSPSLMSRFASFSRNNSPTPALKQPSSQSVLSTMRFQVADSNSRPDSVVAKEWWISHLITEPSIVTALFCGQFKSTLRCTQCGNTSTRFEPFSSLQLPLMDETAMLSPRSKQQYRQIVVVLHFLDSPCDRSSLRVVVQVGLDWTVEQLLIKLQRDHATYSNTDTRRDHIAVTLNGFAVDDYTDPDALLTTVSTPINVFEIDYGDQARAFGEMSVRSRDAEVFEAGTEVLARASHERWVKAVVERQGLPAPDGSGSQSPNGSVPLTYHLRIQEAGLGARVCLGRSDICPRTTERFVLLRFLHRRPGLVPFYSTSPYRLVICGFPFVCRLPSSLICGRGLYHMVHRKFASGTSSESSKRRSFVLKRVRSDGKCCGHCHWMEHCDGCKIDRLDEEPLDLEMDETIAIDWAMDAHEPAEEWLAGGSSIEDHTSYVAYKLDNTHSLEKSLQILCSEEHVDARCSRCASNTTAKPDTSTKSESLRVNGDNAQPPSPAFVPHTKTLALWSLPPVLVIQLKRFELVDDGGYSWQRLNHSVDFHVEDFDIAEFLAPTDALTHPNSDPNDRDEVSRAELFLTEQLKFPTDTASREVTSYRLYGLVNHMGDLGGGHYTAHIRHPDNADWWLVDDASATPANPQTLSPSSSAYLLFYVREDLDTTAGDDDHDDEIQGVSGLARPVRGLSDFYPRQPHASPVADAAVRALCKQDFWQRLPTSKSDGKRDNGDCTLM